MLEADSSMAVGLAIFLPTAWANGCRAPCEERGRPKSLGADILQGLRSRTSDQAGDTEKMQGLGEQKQARVS